MAVTKENSCAFYASDYHLEMIMLPYINKNFENNKNVYVFTQNDLENTINTLIEKVNIKQELKEKVLNINWKIDDENKYNKLIKEEKESIIFVKGNEEYINKVNNNLEQIKKYKRIEIIDCYNMEEVGNKAINIVQDHKNILMTNGKK